MAEVVIKSRYPRLSHSIPGCVTSVATAQDPLLPGGVGLVSLDYAATPSSKLAFKGPTDAVVGAYSADLDTADPANVVLTSPSGRFIVLDVTSLTLAAVHVDTDYAVEIVPAGTVLWHSNTDETFKQAIERAVREGCDFTAADFSGCDLSGCDLKRMNARWANGRGANLCGCNISGADFSYADLTGANAAGITADSATLYTGATVTGVDEFAEVVGALTVGSSSVSASGDVPATTSTEFVICGAAAAVVRTVPTAVGCRGRRIRFWNTDGGATPGQIASTAAETFGGGASPLLLDTLGHGWEIESDGANWDAVHLAIYKPRADAYTPAVAGDWTGTDPTTIQEALDRIAAAMTIHLISP